jgi:hypothetical protein
VMRSCILVPWRLSRACTLRASAKSKKSCIAPWPTHGLRSESCACVSASRKRRHLSGNLTSRSFGGYGRQRDDEETGEFMLHTLALTLLHCLLQLAMGLFVNSRVTILESRFARTLMITSS